ncbi:MAG TPA: LysR family transcriptional regulator [Vicinamibacterales bacterium]|jgi:DNA-binding transcriptional LysR family regulator|nr:LysR family transcriptional regulator [Vicinamibacterales bacterium]
MQLPDLAAFLAVAADRSFSAAARRLHRTQPAISQAVRRIEDELGERLFDRSSRDGTLTEAGRLLQDYAQRLLGLASEAQTAIQELQQVRRGRVIMGANEAAVHTLLPHIERFATLHPNVAVEVRRVPSRQIANAVLDRSIDFGVLTFQPADRGVQAMTLGGDEIVLLTSPRHPLAGRRRVTLEEIGRQVVIAHNDPSPARDRVLRAYERRRTSINIQISLPSLDGIKRAVEMGIGVALLPRRCALTEIARGHLAAMRVPELGATRQVRLVFRRTGERSRAAEAFLEVVKS